MPDNGRPSKLTPEIQEKIVQALSIGNYRKDAAEYAGIDAATLRRWLLRGAREKDSAYADFRTAVLEAESRAKITAIGCITKAMRNGDWRAAAYWLERKFPHQYSDRSQLFLIQKTFEQVESAAEAAGIELPDSVWETAWTTLAADLAQKLPSQLRLDLKQPSDLDDELGDIDVTDEQRDALFELLHAQKRRVVHAEVIDPSPS